MSLGAPMADGEVRLEPLAEVHREPLRRACADDPDIWEIYPTRFFGGDFDPAFESCLKPGNLAFAAFHGNELVGMTSYLTIEPKHGTVQIGRTYFAPAVRGTGFNRLAKKLMLDRAFACGFRRVEFKIDTRNRRSMAAVEKLGAVREGTLRKQSVTWTGYVRDAAVYSILDDEWPALRAALDLS